MDLASIGDVLVYGINYLCEEKNQGPIDFNEIINQVLQRKPVADNAQQTKFYENLKIG